jgi:hypothetical protein
LYERSRPCHAIQAILVLSLQFSRLQRLMHLPHEVYQNELKAKYKPYGWALWEPDRENPNNRVLVGDVGFISDGRFVRIFNIRLKSDDPKQCGHGVPEGYYPIEPALFIKRWLESGDYHSNSVKMTKEDG